MTITPSAQKSASYFSRRQFLKHTSEALAGAAVTASAPLVHAAGPASLEIKIGLIGCGGRGTGAIQNILGASSKVIYPAKGYHTEDVAEGAAVGRKNAKVVALADLFADRADRCQEQLNKLGVAVPKSQCFVGFDAYKELLAIPEINYVILATPPHFRPAHFKAAVDAGKNVFMEKPVAVDIPGVKTVMEVGQLAKQKNLGVAAGTQRRHTKSYQETIRRIRDGAIGDIAYARCYWDGGGLWYIPRQSGWSDTEWQLRNWNYFTWLSGDHIVEQHVHNLDVMNWVIGTHPERVVAAVGGRQVRTAPEFGHIFDHFAVEFEYPGGVRMFSQCRQTNGADALVEEAVVGIAGTSNCHNLIRPKNGEPWQYRGPEPNGYHQEHDDLIASIQSGNPINEAQAVAESTMTSILGREAAYSGRAIEWDAAMKSTKRLGPEKYEFGDFPTPPVAMPGIYRFS